MNKRKLISNAAEFPSVKVYEHEESNGKIYTVIFQNLEILTEWEVFFLLLAIIAVISVVGPIAFLVLIGVSLLSPLLLRPGPLSMNRDWKIVLDYGRDRFLVLRKKKLKVERPLSQLKHVTVDQHPDTDLERENRRARKQEGPGLLEKTHCLLGWFGRGGAEQVVLVSRMEWPSRNSLREVREAIEWIRTVVAPASAKNEYSDDGWD